MLIETEGAEQFWDVFKQHFNIKHTTMNSSSEAITILIVIGNHNMIVGRYCKTTKKGVVMDRRKEVRVNEIINTNK